MIEPKRFLDAKGAPGEITHLLRVARRDAPPQGLRSSTWQALVAKSAAAGVAVGAASAATTQTSAMAASVASGSSVAVGAHGVVSKGLLLLALKSACVCGGVGVCALATHHVLSEARHADASATASGAASRASSRARDLRGAPKNHASYRSEERTEPSALPPPAAREMPRGELDKAAAQGSSPERMQPSAANAANAANPRVLARGDDSGERAFPRAGESADRARFEAQRVTEIRRMLRGGDGVGALQSLADLDRQASVNLLVQEREALRIDAHLLLGHEGEVRRLVQRFRERYPHSPLAARWTNW